MDEPAKKKRFCSNKRAWVKPVSVELPLCKTKKYCAALTCIVHGTVAVVNTEYLGHSEEKELGV